MTQRLTPRVALCLCGAAWWFFAPAELRADDSAYTQEQLRQLRRQNEALQEQLRNQQKLIDSLSLKVNEIQDANTQRSRQLDQLETDVNSAGAPAKEATPSTFGKINLSGEGGIAFFHTGSEGSFPYSEFRIDELRLFLEAPIVNSVYLFTEVDLATREQPDVQLRLGEVYLDFENVSRLWGQDRLLNLRVGRFYVPFGEEYLTRYAIDNPLISHSLSDLWGVDEGIEFYGRLGKFSYAVGIQNGGIPDTRDFNPDKSIAGRLGFDPAPWLHLSASAMRTGALDVQRDQMSAMWFGNGFFRSLGSGATTTFQADLAEGDIDVRLPHGFLRAFGGIVHYEDNDPAADNQQNVYYYSVEAVHDLVGHLYGAVRFSQIFADKGFPIVANGDFSEYFFRSLTTDLWRLSLGVGYRWNENLLLKAEYSFERGSELSGDKRNHEDLFAMEAAFKF